MASRSGGFGGSLNPFGRGSFGSLGQYDIGADLADLEVYKVEVAWGNGTATDDEYLAALTKARNATDPSTQRRETAQNKLDDAVYRIGRSKAETKGLDTLIAYDQGSIAKMNPNNLRYRTVKESLDAELAQRRSRDYGKLVDRYNAGKTTTKALQSWVHNTLSGLDKSDPDFDNWTGVASDLADRVKSEKDSAVYQDFEHRRIKPSAFLAYVQSRRDGYDRGSPKYEDWDRKLEDARERVRDDSQGRKDTIFFDRYQEGKVSDGAYLKYLRTRLAGMPKDDPQRPEWQHRLNQAAFSLAEDKLRFDVEHGRAPVGRLISFYRAYRAKLNPGSAEWRQITRALDVLHAGGGLAGGGGGGGGRGRRASGRGGGSAGGSSGGKSGYAPDSALGSGPALRNRQGKLIDPKYSLSNILGLFTLDVTANKHAQSAAKKYMALNMDSLTTALQRGDEVWLFHDPRRPGDTVEARYPDGRPILDGKGNPVMVPGSAFLPSSNEAFANLKSIEAGNFMSLAEVARQKGRPGDYAYNLKRAEAALDSARLNDSQVREQDWESWYKSTQRAVDDATAQGDYVTATRLATDLAKRLASEQQNPYLDDTRRRHLDDLGDRLRSNPLIPHVDEGTGMVQEGALNLTALAAGEQVLNPGWHHVLKSDKYGRPAYGPVYDDRQDGSWEAGHVSVNTVYGGQVVTGEVEVRKADVTPQVIVNIPGVGRKVIELGGQSQFIAFQDENGRTVKAYSLDGQTWISPGEGQPAPVVEIDAQLVLGTDEKGNEALVDATTGAVAFVDEGAGWSASQDYFAANPEARKWYGETRWRTEPKGVTRGLLQRAGEIDPGIPQVGAPGQQMTLVDMSESGQINLTPPGWARSRILPAKPAGERNAIPRGLSGTARGRLQAAGEVEADVLRLGSAGQIPSLATRTGEGRGTIIPGLPVDSPPRFEGSGGLGRPRSPDLPIIRPTLPAALPPTVMPRPRSPDLPVLRPATRTPLPPRPKPPALPPALRAERERPTGTLPAPPRPRTNTARRTPVRRPAPTPDGNVRTGPGPRAL